MSGETVATNGSEETKLARKRGPGAPGGASDKTAFGGRRLRVFVRIVGVGFRVRFLFGASADVVFDNPS